MAEMAFSLEEALCGSTGFFTFLNKLLDHHPNCFESLFVLLEWGPTLQVSFDNPRIKGNESKELEIGHVFKEKIPIPLGAYFIPDKTQFLYSYIFG